MHPSKDGMCSETGPTATMEMPQYKSHKTVWALEIDTVEFERALALPRLTFRDHGYAAIEVPVEMFARYKPVPGDFYVVYADGYKSFSPRKAFLEGYMRQFSQTELVSSREKVLKDLMEKPGGR